MNSEPSLNPAQRRTPNRLLRWTARIASLASLAVMTAFLIGEGFDPARLTARDLALVVFFPFGMMFGLILGWPREFLGGLIAIIALAGFYLLHLVMSGGFPHGWAFIVLAVPGVLFLISAAVNRPAHRSSPQRFNALTS